MSGKILLIVDYLRGKVNTNIKNNEKTNNFIVSFLRQYLITLNIFQNDES